MRQVRRLFIFFLLLGLSVLLFSCGGGGGGGESPTGPTTSNVSGNWSGTISGGDIPSGTTISLSLTQSGNTVTGTVSMTIPGRGTSDPWNISSGSASDSTLRVSFTPTGSQNLFTLTRL